MSLSMKYLTTTLILLWVLSFGTAESFAAVNVRLVEEIDGYSSHLDITASSTQAVQFNLDIEAVGVSPDAIWGGDYNIVELPDGEGVIAGSLTEEGKPQLPALTTLIAIPDMAGVSLTVSYESYEIVDNIDVLPVQKPVPERGLTEQLPFSIDEETYNDNSFYPGVLAEAGEPAIMRDVRVVQVTVYPVHYNPVSRQLKVYRNISVDISFDGEVVNPKTVRHDFISEAFYPLYQAYISNFDSYLSTLTTAEVKRGGILIITPNIGSYMWKDEMQELANWKRRKGYDVVLATTYDVTPDGTPSQTELRNYIVNAYNTWEVPPEFVYLVGDEDISYGGYLMPDYPYSSYASDHWYSRLEGSDYLPDAAVCRVAVDYTNELTAWIAKVFKYEKEPLVDPDPQWWRRAIMVAGGQQTETCPWTVLWTRERLLDYGFVHIDTVIDRGWDPPDSYITNPITAGVGYVNYRGWAGSSGWWDPSYNISSLNQCQNVNKPGVMTSIVCGTGDFGVNLCFGEQWIRMGSSTAPRGGPAFFGSTDHSTHTRWNNPITVGFYSGLLYRGIYNFGMAVIAGKMRQFQCFPREYSMIQKYFHTYNMLGDPELELRLTTPIPLSVVFPSTIEAGTNFIEVEVTDNTEHPIEGAYVTLIMGEGANESFFAVAKTDGFGYCLIEVPTDTTGDLELTVTGRDLFPFMATISLGTADEMVAYESHVIDDDMSGSSNGNGDGQASPAETIELTVEIQNFGSSMTANNVTAMLTSPDENLVAIHRNAVEYGQIGPGQTSSGDDTFVLTILPSAEDGDVITLRLDVTSDSNPEGWSSFIHLPVVAPKLVVVDVQIDGNGRLDPNETADITVHLANFGEISASGVTGTLQTSDGYVQISPSTASFGNIAVGDTSDNSGSEFTVSVDVGTFEGKNVPFVLNLSSADGATYKSAFDLTVGVIAASDPAGPDAYGYYVYDNTDTEYAEQPTYSWNEIRTIGTNLYLSDDTNTLVDLPFDFVYYGDTYNRITVCDNGWICMDSTQWVIFRNWPMPDPSYARAMVAGFWDDLGPSGSDNVYTYYDSDNHRFIIEWSNVRTRWNYNVRETFQIILYDPQYHQSISGDGIIEFAYNNINNGHSGSGENYCSVGWEDMTELVGFSISYSNFMSPGCATLGNGRVYRITTNTGRGGISGTVDVTGGFNGDVLIESETGQWTTSQINGFYSLAEVPPGTVDLTISKTGWFPQTITGVNVMANEFSQGQNTTLEICPVPQGLEASEGLGDHVQVSWTEVSHPDLAGYDIYRSHWENGIFTRINDTPVSGGQFDDYTTEDGVVYWYYVTAVFSGADYEAQSLGSNKDSGSNEEATGIDDNLKLPVEFALSQNYPNPFNARTVIRYALPTSGRVSLEVFNILGQRIIKLVDGYQQAGYKSVTWDGRDVSGDAAASGIYFYRLTTPTENVTKRMLMLK